MMDETTHFLFNDLEKTMSVQKLYSVTGNELDEYNDIAYSRRRVIGSGEIAESFIVAIYKAYGKGRITYANNGIVVISETNRNVILDGHMHLSNGENAPTKKQKLEVDKLIECDPYEFLQFIRNHRRTRINPNIVYDRVHPVGDYDADI